MISNSVTHLRSYTNSAITGNSVPKSPETPRQHRYRRADVSASPLEFVFQEQSYSSLHSGRSLAWDHVRGDIDDPCGAIADFCGVIADFCGVITDPYGVVAIPEAIGGRASMR